MSETADPTFQPSICTPEELARAYHEAYEILAPEFDYEIPANNRALMIAVAERLWPYIRKEDETP